MPLTLNRKKNYGASDAEGGNALAVNQNQQTAQALKTGAYNPTGASPSLTPKASGPNEEFIKPNGFVVAKANSVYNVARTAAERTADLTWAKPVAARKVSDVYGGYNSLGEQKAASRLSSQGSFASAREAEAAVWLASGNDQVARDNAYAMLDQDYDTPGSSFYNPYRKTTNQKALDELSALGIDTSGGVNDAFFARNSAYMQYSRTGAAGTPLAPSKNSSKENNAAYWLYQLQKDEETTKSAESEWNDMVKTISHWTNKGLSDDEIIAKAKAGKHTTLDKLDAGRQAGVPVQLNRSVGYSEDAMYGAIWAARNGDTSGDYFGDSVRYALGQGKSYASSSRKEAQRDASSAEYQPYTSGSTMDDARMAFGVDSFDRDWLNTNKTIMNGTDEKTQTLYQKVYAAEDVTEKAESELSALKQALVAQASTWKGTAGELVQSLLGQDTYATLRKMDAARNAGDPLALTRSVDYRDTDMVRYAQTLLTGGKKISRKDAAGMATPATDTVSGASQTVGMTAAPSSNGVPVTSSETDIKSEGTNASVASPGDTSVTSGNGPRVALTAEGAAEALKAKNAAETSAEGQTDGLVAQRQELIDQLAGYRNSEIKGQTLDKQKADVVAQINALTAQIGDKYAVRVDYTPEQLKSVLTKVFSGSGGLDEQEQAVFDSFTDEYHGLFGTADTQGAGGQYKYFSESSDFGKTAAEALTWADDKDASSDDMVKVMTTIAQDWQDARTDALTRAETDQGVIAQAAQQGITPAQWVQQNASRVPVDLDAWYETHPQDKADLLSVKDSVSATRDAQAQKAAADAEETKKANLSACVDVMKTVAGGGKLTDQQQTVYNAIQSIPESTIQQDTGYADRYTSLANSVADGSLAVKLNLGEQDVWKANDYASYIENYYAKDAKVAAACGMTLDEMYQKFPQMQKSDEQLLQMATQDYDDKWTVTDDQDSAAGLGFWKTVGLGVSSGAQDWWAGKVNFTSAVLDQRENVTSAANYGTYVDKYGYANARSAYRSDVQKAIEAMPDGDRKTRYQQMLEASNGKDIFNLPFNFPVEQLNDYHEQIVQNIQSQSDLVQKYGTTFEKNTVYPESRNVTNNGIPMTEATVVRVAATAMGIPGVVAYDLGTLAGYGEAQFGDTYWEAKNRGLSVDSAKCLATLQTAITAMMEGPMLEKYVGGDLGEGIVAAVTEQAKQEGAGFFKRLGANALRYAMNGLGEAVQENAEDIAGGVVNALAYGDASELTSQLDPQKIIETSVMSFVTSLFLSAQGDLTQKAVGALSGGTAAAEETKQAQTDQTQTPGDQSAQTQTDQTAQTENTNDKKQDEGNSSKSSVDPQALAVNAVRAMLESSEVMSQVTDAVAGKLTVDKIGQGAMNTEAVQAVTERSQQAQETLDKATQEMNAARKALTVISGKLTQLTEKAGTPEGAQQIAQLTQQAAQIRERYLVAKESQSKAQTAADSAAQDMESVRKGTYRQVQTEARAEAQERVQAQAQAAKSALANQQTIADPNETANNAIIGETDNGQQQNGTAEGVDHAAEPGAESAQTDGLVSVGLSGEGEKSGNPGDTEELPEQGSSNIYPGSLNEKGSPSSDASAAPQTNSSDGVIPGGPVDGATENQGSASGPQRQFGAQTAQESDAIHESVKDYLREHSAYDPQSDQTLIDKAIDRVMTSDYNNLVADFTHNDLKTLNSPENQALGVVLMGMAAQNNDVRTEMDIADTYNRMGTEAGRTLQARKVFDLMSPLGAVKYVQKTIGEVNSRYAGQTGKEGVTVSEDTIRRIGEAQTLEDRQDAVDAAMKEITAQIKPTLMDRLNSWRYLAMLGNPRTHIRNIIGNSVFAPSVAIKNKVAAAIEAMVLKPGDRTKSLAIVTDQQYREAAEQYYQQDKDRLKEGGKFDAGSATTVDMRKIEQERRSWGNTPGGRLMEWLSDKNGQALEAEDALFKSGYYKHALASWLQANKVDLQTADESTILKAREYAFNEAQKDTYNNRSELVKMINQFENGLRNRGGRYRAGAMLMEGAIPFKNTPVNIISRGLEYSPAGLADTLIAETGKLRKGDITASQYIDKLSAGLTGTGTFALGILLSSMGMLRASIPDDDEGKQLKLNGAQEYSVEIGGKSYTIDWTAPASVALFCGAEMQKIFQGQGVSSVGEILSAVSKLTSPIMNLTMLSGLNNLFDNNSYDEGIGNLERVGITTMESYVGQFVPTLLGQIARVIDPVRRSNYTDAANGFDSSIQYFVNKQRNKIPFLSTLSAPYVDAWGRQDVTPSVWQRMLENFVSPGYLNDLTDDQVSQGLATLAGESADTGVYPDAMPKTVTVNKQSVKLGGEQWAQYQTGAGTVSRTLIGSMLNNPDFAGLDPAYQARVVKDVYAYAKKTAQDAVTGGVKLDKWIQNAQAGDPVSVIVEREKKIQTSDYVDGTQDAMQGYILQGDTGSIQTCVDALTVLGLDGNQIKTRATTAVKEAWQKGDDDTRSAIEGTLMDAGLGFTRKDFDKWLADMTKGKK